MKSIFKNRFVASSIYFKENGTHFIFMSVFTLGVAIGAFSLLLTGKNSQTVVVLINDYFEENANLGFMELFSRNFLSNMVFLAIIYIGGLCAIGLPFVAIIPLVKGIGIGAIISYKYIFNGIKGFLYTLVIILIPMALLLVILCYAYKDGIGMSLTVSGSVFGAKPNQHSDTLSFAAFTKRNLFYAFGLTLVSLLEAGAFTLFSKII